VPPKVFNKHGLYHSDAVLVDRTTPFGNPFVIGRDGTREEVIDKYERWIFQSQQRWLREKMIAELRGKDLLCWCAPEECHADIIVGIANAR
jgi:Domain of unknown function (DUF4326)